MYTKWTLVRLRKPVQPKPHKPSREPDTPPSQADLQKHLFANTAPTHTPSAHSTPIPQHSHALPNRHYPFQPRPPTPPRHTTAPNPDPGRKRHHGGQVQPSASCVWLPLLRSVGIQVCFTTASTSSHVQGWNRWMQRHTSFKPMRAT